jgi:hypothetical protein
MITIEIPPALNPRKFPQKTVDPELAWVYIYEYHPKGHVQ